MQKPAGSPARPEGSRQGLTRRGAPWEPTRSTGHPAQRGRSRRSWGPVRGCRGHREGRVCESPAAAVTNGYKLSGLKQHKFFVSRSGGQKSGWGWTQGANTAGSLGDPGKAHSGFLQLLEATCAPWLTPCHSARHLRVTCVLTDTPAPLPLPL